MYNEHFKASSFIAYPIFAGLALLLCFVAAYFGATVVSGFLFFMFLLSCVSYFWGKFSENNITVDLTAPSYRVYPEQDVVMQYTLKNDKFLPLLWLEWFQPYPPNNCFDIPEDFEVCDLTYSVPEIKIVPMLCKGFSFLKWYSTINWTSNFHAARRGVYVPDTIEIHTGDGFGLSARRREFNIPSAPVFVVYPKRVEVSTDAFFKNSWSASTGSHGIIEDVTVLRGTRDYSQNDSFKRINWRLAARSDELSVNVYDMIAPRSVYFFIDTASFFEVSEDNAAFEETLSVVGSLVSELFELEMTVAVYLPNRADGTSQSVELDATSAEDCLLALALCDCNDADAQFSRQGMAALLSSQSGNIYYVCHDAEHGSFTKTFDEAGIASYSVISYKEPDKTSDSAVNLSEINLSLVSDFKKG